MTYSIHACKQIDCFYVYLKVELEIYAQVEAFRLLANGKLPEFADGHQHVHVLPGETVIKLEQVWLMCYLRQLAYCIHWSLCSQ